MLQRPLCGNQMNLATLNCALGPPNVGVGGPGPPPDPLVSSYTHLTKNIRFGGVNNKFTPRVTVHSNHLGEFDIHTSKP